MACRASSSMPPASSPRSVATDVDLAPLDPHIIADRLEALLAAPQLRAERARAGAALRESPHWTTPRLRWRTACTRRSATRAPS